MEILKEKGIVKEMVTGDKIGKIEVPFAKNVDIKKLTKGDKNPLFVTVEALNPTISENGKIWTEEIINNVAEQIMEKRPDAYQGHLKEEDRDSVSPTAKTIWIGAAVKNIAGKPRLFIKGYVLPYAKQLKQYLKVAKAAGKKVAVSVYGKGIQIWNQAKKAYDMQEFNLESIDWARPGAEGVPGTGYLGLASEMKGEKTMNRADVIKSTTISEMKTENPELLKKYKTKVQKKIISEMKSISEKLESFEKAFPKGFKQEPETIKEMIASHEGLINEYLEASLDKRCENASVRRLVSKEVISEMTGKFMTKEKVDQTVDKVMQSKEIKSIIQEMANFTSVNPVEDNKVEEKGYKYLKA